MRTLRPLALVLGLALAGAVGTVAVAALTGMPGQDLAHLAAYVAPAALVTVAATALAGPLLARAPLRRRLSVVAAVGAAVGFANLFVLSRLMFVSDHDAALLGILLVYAVGAGVGSALAISRADASAIERLARTAEALGEGSPDARVGRLDTAPELDALGRALDEMADRLHAAADRERTVELQRRDLITAISHDLRTPLASLRAMVEAIDDGVVEDAPSLRRYVGEMRRAVHQLSSLVDDLFELVQLDVGAIAAERERTRLGDVVGTAVAAIEHQARTKGLVLQTDLAGAEDTPCSPRVTRVLQNLLVNAIRHTPSDGTVRIEARRDRDRLEVAVEDTGEGITPEDLDRVFEPFFRGDPARSGGGAGLGLALAKRIVEAIGGRIEVESGPSEGARFAIRLPL